MSTRGYQKWGSLLIVLSGILMVLLVNGTLILARVEPQTTHPASRITTSEIPPQTAAALPSLQQTASISLYLPILLSVPTATTGCDPTGGSGGLEPGAYDTTVAGLEATVVVGQGYSPDTPTYLSFYIHGNDGDIHWFTNPNNRVTKVVDKYGWIFVAPHSPQGNSWSSSWNESLNEAFANVLDEMFAKYNVCRRVVIGSTVSGGSIFWTKNFFPLRGADYQAHTSILCGAWEVPKSSRPLLEALGQDPTIVANSTFDYIYGTKDYLLPNIEDSIADYTNAGFTVQQFVIEGGGHCNEWWRYQNLPNIFVRIADDWEARVQELKLE